MGVSFFGKILGIFVGFAALSVNVGISPKGIRQLRKLIHTDNAVKVLYDSIQLAADVAMGADPNPIDTLRTEGLLQGDPRKMATWEAIKDLHKMYALAVAWRVTGRQEYFNKASVYLFAWADSNHSRGDPIDDTNLDPAIDAYDMIKGQLTSGESNKISGWLRQTAEAEIHSTYNRPERATSHNNWNSHRLKIIGEIGFTIGDKQLQTYAINGIRQQIEHNLKPDGSSEDFISRDALHYHVYDLEPLLKLAIVLKRATEVDYYHYVAPSGSSLSRSVQWLLPYVDGRQTHAEFVNSTVEFDRRRAQNGQAEFRPGTLFDPRHGIGTVMLAAWFDEELLPLTRKLTGNESRYPNWQAVINELNR